MAAGERLLSAAGEMRAMVDVCEVDESVLEELYWRWPEAVEMADLERVISPQHDVTMVVAGLHHRGLVWLPGDNSPRAQISAKGMRLANALGIL